MRHLVLSTLVCLGMAQTSTQAAHFSMEDFELFAVQGNIFYGYSDNLTNRQTLFTTFFDYNHLAADPARDRLLFMQNDPVGFGQVDLWAYEFDNDLFRIIGTVGVSDFISGGATFYNGSYYLYDDNVENRVVKVDFDATGFVTSKTVFAPGEGVNLGDIATDTLRGKMYILADNSDFYALDINNPGSGFSLVGNLGLGDPVVSQIAFDSRGRLIASGPHINRWHVIDPLTATSVATIPVTFPTTSLFDLATGAAPLPPASADFDSDGDVDGIDFLRWQRRFGIDFGATRLDGDADSDADVDADDLAIWETNFGSTIVGSPISAAVPEPSGLLLVFCGLFGCRLAMKVGRNKR